ncbi:Serine/threonine-protein phosphatase 4 regulatory subunit 2 [Camponotus floridanus]|uniref:Serine/threonine-protein phosphatase 4 regulatory subunit 2 n=1 Tax=Camponotus floridanus TaxID=104421 RepID=E1ZWK7_CAMFO|nr:Serine/threonine-protein phosphatase 4 regulatory subunit 2 [Camponotus floridanus]
MENLEEVLQALDEFQKMRPTVIPQELEDYLCWVAKTGDPVYQWPLIKTLFREKLTRVMTDFYENCPNLEFATCPNVEHFNYDAMKSNLLERLESFANAPFTVQRICELLTSPRKEYNRVDKFMRAIEKNILVVSTREPGPIARRGETGDGMVNGSVEEDTASVTQQQPPPPPPSPSPSLSPSQLPSSPSQPPQTTQPVQPTSQDVEMEYWEKDCTSTVTISVHTVTENEPALLHNDVPTTGSPVTKSVFTETAREKLEQASSRTEIAPSNYISAASEFSSVSNLTSQSHEPVLPNVSAVPIVQNLPAVGTMITDKITSDSSVSATDIAEVIMNEDTNSQPNLDIENEEIEAVTIANTTRNLQAAFQAKRFESDSDNKCLDNKSDEKAPIQSTIISVEDEGVGHSTKSEETALNKLNSECVDSNEMSCNENRLTENLLQTDIDMRSDALENNIESNNMKEINAEEIVSNKPEEESTSVLEDTDKENLGSKNNDKIKTAMFVESELEEKDSTITSEECMSAVIVSNSEALYKPEKTEMHSKEVSVMISSKESFIHDQSISQKKENTEVTDNVIEAVPRVASPNSNDNEQEVEVPELNTDNLKVMEVSNDKAPLVESMISLPVSTIEKPKEATSVIEKFVSVSPTVEMTESSDISCQSLKDEKLTEIQDDSSTNVQDNKTICITTKENQSSVIESIICLKEHESTELMEVDEESLSTFQQDEPMEQETMEELSKS